MSKLNAVPARVAGNVKVRKGVKEGLLPYDFVLYGAGFLFTHAVPLPYLAPFGLSVLSMEKKLSLKSLFLFLAVCIGYLSLGDFSVSLRYIAAATLYMGVLIAMGGRQELSGITAISVTGGSLLLTGLATMFFYGFHFTDIILLVCDALLMTIGSIVLSKGGNLLLDGKISSKSLDFDEKLSVCIVLCLVVLSFKFTIPIVNINAGNVLCAAVIMILSAIGGLTYGVVSGITAGVLMGFGNDPLSAIACFGAAGIVGGLFSKGGKKGSVIGFGLTALAFALYLGFAAEQVYSYLDIVLAVGIVSFLPPKVFKTFEVITDFYLSKERDTEKLCERFKERLCETAESFRNLADTFSAISDKQKGGDINDISVMFDATADKVCHSCRMANKCWREDFQETYRQMLSLLEILENKGRVTTENISPAFLEKCKRPSYFIEEINRQFEIFRINQVWKHKLTENRELTCEQFRGIADIIQSISDDVESYRAPEKKNEERLNVSSGIAQGRLDAECGDSHLLHYLETGKYIITLSDGMGTGKRAAKESHAIVDLLNNFLRAGFDKTTAVKLINSIMVMKSAQEAFATVDMCVIDLCTGEVEFIKNGAEPGYIKRSDYTEIVRSTSLPIGLMSVVEVETFARKLEIGDTIVMVTDGIKSKDVKRDWVYDMIDKSDPNMPAKELADRIMEKSIALKGGTPDDDVTVIVLKIN